MAVHVSLPVAVHAFILLTCVLHNVRLCWWSDQHHVVAENHLLVLSVYKKQLKPV